MKSADPATLTVAYDTAAGGRAALGVPVGAIVKSLVFAVGETPVMALIAGDRRCATEHLPRALQGMRDFLRWRAR